MSKEKLPKNWVETELKNIISFVIGGDWGKDPSKVVDDDEFKEVSCIRGSEIKNWKVNKGSTASLRKIKKSSLEKRELKVGDILVEISGGGPDQPVGRILFIDQEALEINGFPKVCTNFLRMLRIDNRLNQKYISHFLEYFYVSGQVIKYQGGSNNLRNLKFKDYQTVNTPIAPRAEQDRIVAKLDGLFEQLESINKSLDHIPTLLKNFKQQVLTQAVTGKLTEEWREGKKLEEPSNILNEIFKKRSKEFSGNKLNKLKEIYKDSESSLDFKIPSKWIEANLDKVCNSFSYGTSTKSDNEGMFPVLRMGNMQRGKLEWSDLKYTSDTKEYEKYRLKDGDVLFNRTNSPELVGKTSIYRGEMDALYAGYLIKIDARKELNSEFLNMILNSNYAKKWCWKVKTDGVSQSNINATKLSKFTIPFPSYIEQQEIVKRVENIFTQADTIEAHYDALKTKVEHLPQAILHKAFKGELVPQLEIDGDARELLEEIEGLKGKVGSKTVIKK